ncbi:MAG: LA_2272 family surface repeat-containing protein [Kiritimatiellia bacterium]
MRTGQLLCGAFALISGFAASGAVERVGYAIDSNIQRREIARKETQYTVDGWSLAAFGVVPMLSFPDANHEIDGLRFNLFAGEHVDVYGLDIGVFGNVTRREFCGLQIAPLFNKIGESGGALQISVFNRCEGSFCGLQVGGINIAEKGAGAQIGLVNVGNNFQGLQLGVINMISASNHPFLPFANFAF